VTWYERLRRSRQFDQFGDRSPQWVKVLRRIETQRESGISTPDEYLVPSAVTSRSWRTTLREARTRMRASPVSGASVSGPTETLRVR
jgi:hypothetical protein